MTKKCKMISKSFAFAVPTLAYLLGYLVLFFLDNSRMRDHVATSREVGLAFGGITIGFLVLVWFLPQVVEMLITPCGRYFAFGWLVTLVIAGSAYLLSFRIEAEGIDYQQIARELISKVYNETSHQTPRTLAVRGGILVLDIETMELHKAHWLIPKHLRASSNDERFTVFIVDKPKPQQVGTYGISKQGAFLRVVDIYVGRWPENQIIWKHTVRGREPPTMRSVDYERPEYGELAEPIADWILRVPREN